MDTLTKEQTADAELMLIRPPLTVPHPYFLQRPMHYRLLKRGADIVVSSVVMVVLLSWLYPLLAVLIRLSSKGGAVFVQKRIGYGGKVFNCYKFRTMVVNAEADTQEAMLNDYRVTRLGKWLRATYIDELLQFFNVLKGDMSIIGPRPHMLYHHRKFCREVAFYNYRHKVKPGITGLSQVMGYHGRLTDRYSIYGRTRLDLFYARKASVRLDLMILTRTMIVFFFKKSGINE